jgi:hypothetical protein
VDLFPAACSSQEILQQEGVSAAAIEANKAGQVQRGNTWPQLHEQSVGVLFTAGDAS